MPDTGKKYVILHSSMSFQIPGKDRESGEQIKDTQGKPVWERVEFSRGEVVPADVLESGPQGELERLFRLKAVREATPDEYAHQKVTLPEGGDLSVSAEALLAGKSREVAMAMQHASKLEQENMELRNQLQSRAPMPIQETESGAELIRAKDTELLKLRQELSELRGELARAKGSQPRQQQEEKEEDKPPPGLLSRGPARRDRG
jgi:hypothetical protein